MLPLFDYGKILKKNAFMQLASEATVQDREDRAVNALATISKRTARTKADGQYRRDSDLFPGKEYSLFPYHENIC